MQPTENSRQFNKDIFDILSILGYVTKKNQSRGARHGQSLRQTMYHKTREFFFPSRNVMSITFVLFFLPTRRRAFNHVVESLLDHFSQTLFDILFYNQFLQSLFFNQLFQSFLQSLF